MPSCARQLARHIACQDTLWLIDRILESGAGVLRDHYDMVYFPGDDLLAAARPRGLPIGNLTSQNWANVYLNDLDQFVKHELRCRAVPALLRRFFAVRRRQGHAVGVAGRDRGQAGRAAPDAPRARAQVYPVKAGIPWLGFRVFPTHRRLLRRNVKAFARRLRAQRDAYQAGEMALDEIQQSVQAWIAHASHGNTYRLRQSLFRQVAF